MTTCTNCQFEFQEGVPFCPRCGAPTGARTRKKNLALEIVSILTLILVGIPAALFGTCMSLIAGSNTYPRDASVSLFALAGFAVFGVTIWFVRRAHKR